MNRPRLQINRVLRRSYVHVNKFYRIDPWTASLTVSDPKDILLNKVNLFIKQIPRNDKDNQRIKEMMIRERKFYKLVSPSIQHCLQIQLGGGHKDNLTISKNYDSPYEDLEILDHMGQDGFITLRRSRRLNVEHCRLVLKGLAHLHAISLVMNKEGIINFENEFPPLSMDIVGEYPIFENFYTYSLEALSREVWDWKGYESFAHVLHILSSKASRHMKTFRGSQFGRVKTLVHGDCWVNNVMFRYSTGNLCNPISLGMIDFQQCRWGCPALDVNHFLFSSSNVDVMENHFGSLVDDYVNTVHQVITKLNYNKSIFPKKEFIEDFHDSFIYGPILAFSHHVVDFQTDKLKADINSFVGSKALEEDSDWRKILQQEHVKNYFKLIFNKIKEKEYNVN